MVDQEIIGSDDAAYLLSFTEEGIDGSEGKLLNIGVCFVDTSTGTFHVGEFEDDNMRTKFRTLLAQVRKHMHIIAFYMLQLRVYIDGGDFSRSIKYIHPDSPSSSHISRFARLKYAFPAITFLLPPWRF